MQIMADKIKHNETEATLYNGNCYDVLRRMQADCIDLTVTSPPYDSLRVYGGNDWNHAIFIKIAKELYRITKPGGVVVWVVADATVKGSETGTSFRQALTFIDIGFRLHDTMIYAKHNPTPNAGNRYQQTFEYMFVFAKGKPKTTNILLRDRHNECNDKRTQRMKKTNRKKTGDFGDAKLYIVRERVPRENIWTYKVGLYNSTKDKEAFQHPAIFPEALAQDHILSWSRPGDVVLDPFAGSGTTGKMALLNGRNFVGIEINEKYYEICKERILHARQEVEK